LNVWALDGEEMMTPALFVLTQYRSVTDGQTDISALAIPALAQLAMVPR